MSSRGHTPVHVPTPQGRLLESVTEEEIDELLHHIEPFGFRLMAVPFGILGLIFSCVALGTVALVGCLVLGLPTLVSIVAMVLGAAAGIPLFAHTLGPLLEVADGFMVRHKALRAVRRLGLRPVDAAAVVELLSKDKAPGVGDALRGLAKRGST